jgi:hypothetical protein
MEITIKDDFGKEHTFDIPSEAKVTYNDEYVERLQFAAAEMQMCLELIISIVDEDRENLIDKHVAQKQSELALDTYHKVLRDFAVD